MYKYLLIFMIIIPLFIVAGCRSSNQINKSDLDELEVKNTTDESTQGDFVFRLVSEKEEYEADEENVKLSGEIEYVGDDEKVTIDHASSAILFNMKEEVRDYEIGFGVDDIDLSTDLEQGVPYREDYEKSVGYAQDDPSGYKRFMKDFQDADDSDFPPGYYVVEGETDFFTNDGEEINIEATIDFKVVH